MELMTKEIEEKLLNAPFGSTDGMGMDASVVVKYFNPIGAGTWLITEGEKQEDGNWILYGYCDLGMGFPEWGYVSLDEMKSVNLPFGMTIERDLYVKDNATVGDLHDAEPKGFNYWGIEEDER